MTSELFDLAVTYLTIRRHPEVIVIAPGLTSAEAGGPDARAFQNLLKGIEHDIAVVGGESTTETADIFLVRRTPSYQRFLQDCPAIVQQVRAVTTVFESLVSEDFEY